VHKADNTIENKILSAKIGPGGQLIGDERETDEFD